MKNVFLRKFLAFLLLVTALSLTACGGEDNSSSPVSTSSTSGIELPEDPF